MKITVLLTGLAMCAAVIVGSHGTAGAEEVQAENAKPEKVIVEVKKSDSLSKIAKKYNSTYQRLFYANTFVKDPDVIHPGEKLRVPGNEEKLKERTIPSSTPVQAVKPLQKPAPKPTHSASRSAQPAKPRTQETIPATQVNGGVWDRIANCESSGNWSINTGNGYYGGLQFSLSSWRAVGGQGYPHQASKGEQIARAQKLQAIQGWGAWPACTSKLGLR